VTQPSVTRPRVGLVLGAGGLAGTAFHAGVIAALAEETGFDARSSDVIVGTSAGAMTAALLRAGLSPADLLARMTQDPPSAEGQRLLARLPAPGSWSREADDAAAQASSPARWLDPVALRAVRRQLARPWRARPGHVAAAAVPPGRRPTTDLAAAFDALLPSWPAGQMWLGTVDIDEGTRIMLGSAAAPISAEEVSVGRAVAASCAIPGYFEPVAVSGRRLVDGAVHSSCNADALTSAEVDVVIVSAPMSARDPRRSDVVQHAMRRQLRGQARQLRASGMDVLVLHPSRSQQHLMSGGMLDPRRRAPMARSAYASVRAWLRWTTHPIPSRLR
jgi:NTE family protein